MKTILLAAASLAVISCQQQQSTEATPDKSPPSAEKPTTPADPSDANSYVGMSLEEGSSRADKAEIKWRVVEEDGKPRPVTMDYRPDRLNFAVEKGKIIRVNKG
ncbi:hypothetical protein [Luteolibacter luteus]|uniref:Uncharacterized protein n=1 Tax=Luteolibacter luteus TaxID=2728835 RepID=A0A858RJA8_9BACT|nr:hypothetical protein [Luteolibacter luteus]QJE96604.1 hypothetical protein HHL09_12685 [Luteolibacter luteus]